MHANLNTTLTTSQSNRIFLVIREFGQKMLFWDDCVSVSRFESLPNLLWLKPKLFTEIIMPNIWQNKFTEFMNSLNECFYYVKHF